MFPIVLLFLSRSLFSSKKTFSYFAADLVRFWSPAVFGVYLIHQQTDIAQRWFSWVNALTGRLGEFWNIVPGETGVTAGRMLLVLLVQSVIVFVICIGIERLRLWVFDRIGKSLGRSAAK